MTEEYTQLPGYNEPDPYKRGALSATIHRHAFQRMLSKKRTFPKHHGKRKKRVTDTFKLRKFF
jgi:hypothetical protein